MTTEDFDSLKELFAKLREHNLTETHSLNPHYIVQLQGQVEESLGLLNDVIDELRTIDPQSVDTLKSVTLQIFDDNSRSH